MAKAETAASQCWVVGILFKNHKPRIGVYDGKPRSHCIRCGAWLEPPRNRGG